MPIRTNYTIEQDIENSINNIASSLSGIGNDASGVIPTKEPVEPVIQSDSLAWKQDTGGIIPDKTLSNVEKRNDLAMESGLASIIDETKLAQYVTKKLLDKPVNESNTSNSNSTGMDDIINECNNIINHVGFDKVDYGYFGNDNVPVIEAKIDAIVNKYMQTHYMEAFNEMKNLGLPNELIMEAAKKLKKKKEEVKAKLKKDLVNRSLKGKSECGTPNNTSSSLGASSAFSNRA